MISLRATGQTALVRRLKQVRNNFSTIVRDVHLDAWLERRTLERFDQGISPEGTAWSALLPQTEARKRRAGAGNNGPLNRSGALRKAIHVIQGGREGIFAINTGLGMRIGIDDPTISQYGKVHNQGLYSGMIKRKQLRRRFLGINPKDVRSMKDMLRRRANVILGE